MTESKELQIWKEMFQDAGPVERRLLWAPEESRGRRVLGDGLEYAQL